MKCHDEYHDEDHVEYHVENHDEELLERNNGDDRHARPRVARREVIAQANR